MKKYFLILMVGAVLTNSGMVILPDELYKEYAKKFLDKVNLPREKLLSKDYSIHAQYIFIPFLKDFLKERIETAEKFLTINDNGLRQMDGLEKKYELSMLNAYCAHISSGAFFRYLLL